MASKRRPLPGSLQLAAPIGLSVCCSVSVVAQAPLGLPASWSLSPWPSGRGDRAGLGLRPPHLQVRRGWLFLQEGASGFPRPLVASSLPAFFSLWHPASARRGAVFGHRGGMALGRWRARRAWVLVTHPRQVGPGQAGEWEAELRAPSHFACLPCFSLPGASAFHK